MMLVLVGAALSRGRHQLAGFVFSLTYYKPPLFLLLLVYLSICYRGRFIRGFLIGALALCGATALIVPASVIQANLGLMGGYHYGSDSTTSFGAVHWPKHGAGLLALLTILTERQFFEAWLLYFSLSILLILGWWRADLAAAARGVSRDLRISFSIACSLFLSIQMVVYDLTLLLIPLFTFGTAVARTQRPVRGLGFLVVGAAAIYLEFLARSWKFGEAGDAVATPLAFTVVLLSFYVVLTSFEGSRAGAGPGKLLAEKSTD
jgi:hypothetical protein